MQEIQETQENNMPEEVSFEDAKQQKQLEKILEEKAKQKTKLDQIIGLNVLRRSKFYYGKNNELREHIATYKSQKNETYAILLNSNKIMKEEINPDEAKVFPILVKLEDLKKMKKVNGNVVRKLQPKTLHKWDQMALVQGTIVEIEKL